MGHEGSLKKTLRKSSVPKVHFPEDDIRSELYKVNRKIMYDIESLFPDITPKESRATRYIKNYHKLLEEGHSPESAMESTLKEIRSLHSEDYDFSIKNKDGYEESAFPNYDLESKDIFQMFEGKKDNSD